MIRTIMVPLDGSVFAEHALPVAACLARHAGATLRLLRVLPPLADYYFLPPMKSDPLDLQLRQAHVDSARAYLEGVAQRMKDPPKIDCDVVEEHEGLTEAVCAYILKTETNLIVMSSHGRGAVARFWLGSNADKLVRTAPVPVLLTRPPETPPPADLRHTATLKHFVLALGGNTIAEKIVAPALAIGKLTGAAYTLIRVVRPAFPSLLARGSAGGPLPISESSELAKIDAQNCRKAEDYLSGVAERLRGEGAKVQTRVEVNEQPAAAILSVAAEVGADLIALETHGRGVMRLLMGSVADKIVRGSSLPVLVCRLPHQLS